MSYAIKMWTIFLSSIFSFLLPWRDKMGTFLISSALDIHFFLLIISYEYHAAKTYFVTYLLDLVLEILRFSWYFGRCSWFFGGCSGFSGECSWFSGGVPGFTWCSGFFGCSGMFQCSGVPGSYYMPRQ